MGSKTLTAYRKALAEARRHIAISRAMAEMGDYVQAYSEAEAAQHAAFDAKDVMGHIMRQSLAATEREVK